MAMPEIREAWPYEVLITVPYKDLVAVDDGDNWQQDLAIKLLEADAGQVGCEWLRWGSDKVAACEDPVVRCCSGMRVSDVGVCYAPLEQQLEERVASFVLWAKNETSYAKQILWQLWHTSGDMRCSANSR